MSSYVERAGSGRTRCTVCGETIGKSALRIVDETTYFIQDDERTKRKYCHLVCAVDIHRHQAYAALVSTRTTDEVYEIAIGEAGRSDPKLVEETRAHRRPTIDTKRAMALDDPLTGQLLADLEANPRDPGLLSVLADQLQQRGDERGELIMLDLSLAGGSIEELAAIKRRAELATALSPPLKPADHATWGSGFLRKLRISSPTPAELSTVLAHPSCRMLEQLELVHAGRDVMLSGLLPRALRFLQVRGQLAAESDLAALPYLERLSTGSLRALAHPTLPRLDLEMADHETLRALSLTDLPGLVHLTLTRHRGDGPVSELAHTGWFERLRILELQYLVFEPSELAELETALAGRRLHQLLVLGTRMTEAMRPRLAALTEELYFTSYEPPRPRDAVVYYEHANKPEWGRGTVVREYEGKVDVQFASGTRTFKANAAFLKKVIE